MSNYHRHMRRDDYDYDDKERNGRNNERRQSRARFRHRDEGSGSRSRSRSRSQSVERRNRYRRRGSYSRSRSRSRSRSHGYAAGRRDRRYGSRRHRDSRSRSRTRSRTPTESYAHARSQQTHRRGSRSPARAHDRHRRSRSRNSSEQRTNKWFEQRRDNANSMHSMLEESNASSSTSTSVNAGGYNSYDGINLENLPLPKRESRGAYYNLDTDEPFDKERIHREMEEKLRAALAKEGKVYPPKKPEASHPVFANDGSFIEIFKKMQEAQKLQPVAQSVAAAPVVVAASTSSTAFVASGAVNKSTPPPPPLVGRRRGGKILKTGVVAKQKAQQETNADPKDFWSLYLAEVNKYKNNACESDGGTRPLVK